MSMLQQIGWDPVTSGKYADVLKPKISFEEILRRIDSESYTKEELRSLVAGKNYMPVIMRAEPTDEAEAKVLGHLTSIYAEEKGEVTLYRELDYAGHELERGVLTLCCPPGETWAAGTHLGHRMKGGVIYTQGDVKAHAGHAMTGGVIRIDGRVVTVGPTLGGRVEAQRVLRPDLMEHNQGKVLIGEGMTPDFQSFYFAKRLPLPAPMDDRTEEYARTSGTRVTEVRR